MDWVVCTGKGGECVGVVSCAAVAEEAMLDGAPRAERARVECAGTACVARTESRVVSEASRSDATAIVASASRAAIAAVVSSRTNDGVSRTGFVSST